MTETTETPKPAEVAGRLDGLVRLHCLPNGTNAEKMLAVKEAISWYEDHGLDWVHVVTYIIAWDHSARGCPFCGRRCF